MNGFFKPPCSRFMAIPHRFLPLSKSVEIVGPFLHHLLTLGQVLGAIVCSAIWISDLVGELMLD